MSLSVVSRIILVISESIDEIIDILNDVRNRRWCVNRWGRRRSTRGNHHIRELADKVGQLKITFEKGKSRYTIGKHELPTYSYLSEATLKPFTKDGNLQGNQVKVSEISNLEKKIETVESLHWKEPFSKHPI